MSHHVLGSTDSYDINRLIEMQGKNDRETYVTLSLNARTEAQTTPSIVVNIRDMDTREELQQVRENAEYAASSRRKGKARQTDGSDSISEESHLSNSARSLDSPTTPSTGTSSAFSSYSPPSSPPTSIRHYSSPITVEAVAATSVMSTAVASPIATPSSSHVPVDFTAMTHAA